MICGCPVISTDCQSGPNEVITHYKNGMLVPTEDAETMSNAIESLIQDNKLRVTMIRNAKNRAFDYSLDKIVEQYSQLLLNNA